MAEIAYNCVALAGTNKVGNLKKLDNGYFEIVLGAFSAFNSVGEFYELAGAQKLLESSSDLQRMILKGRLRSEAGHPRRQPGMTDRDWLLRILDIYEPNTCAQIRRVRLAANEVRDASGRPVIAAIGEVRPSGIGQVSLQQQLENPDEDVCFSIRSLTADRWVGGVKHKDVRKIVTWDNVNEPGIESACKFRTPSLESARVVSQVLDQASFNLYRMKQDAVNDGLSMESNSNVFKMIGELERVIKVQVPASFGW